MGGPRGCVVSREDITAERQGDNDQHQHFLDILDGLIDNKLAIKKRLAVLTDILTAGGVESREIILSKLGRRRQAIEQKLGVRVLLVSRSPVKESGDQTGSGDSVDKGTGHKFGGRIGGVDGSK
jgi:hypothetical protein